MDNAQKRETVYLICGPARHGKDSIATQIGSITGQPPMACSVQIVNEMAYEVTIGMLSRYAMRRERLGKSAEIMGEDHYNWLRDEVLKAINGISKDVKGNPDLGLRHHLIALGDDKAEKDKIYWIKAVVETGGRVIPGVRRIEEIKQGVEWLGVSGFDVKTVWIQRPNGPRVTDNLDFNSEEYEFDFLISADEGAYSPELMMQAAEHIVTKAFGNITIHNDGVTYTTD